MDEARLKAGTAAGEPLVVTTTSLVVTTTSEEETEALGRRVAEALPPGTVIALSGPLGAGKTVFARGVASGLGIDPAAVSSPTFVYLVDYTEGRLPFVHADLYRFGDVPEEAAETAYESIGLLDAMAGDAITLIEWWPYYRGPAPERMVSVELAAGTGDVRSIHLDFRGLGLDAARRRALP